jgi:hypothetical protein
MEPNGSRHDIVCLPVESSNKAFKSDSQRLAVSLRSSIAKRRSHLNAALGKQREYEQQNSESNRKK